MKKTRIKILVLFLILTFVFQFVIRLVSMIFELKFLPCRGGPVGQPAFMGGPMQILEIKDSLCTIDHRYFGSSWNLTVNGEILYVLIVWVIPMLVAVCVIKLFRKIKST